MTKKYRLYGACKCFFIYSTVKLPGVYFQNGWEAPVITADSGKLQRATHGFYPDQAGYTTVFGGRGPAFAAGAREASMTLADEGATLAAAMGLKFSRADGKIRKNLLSISGN